MSKPIFLCDVDGVVADFLNPAVDVINRIAGTSHRAEDLKTWNTIDGFGVQTHEKAIYAELGREGFCRSLPVASGAREAVRELMKLTDLYFVTAPMHSSPTWVYERSAWLAEHFGAKLNQIVHTSAKHIIRGDFFLDDRPDHVLKWFDRNMSHVSILWHQPYNADADVRPGVRFHEWQQVLDVVEFSRKGIR